MPAIAKFRKAPAPTNRGTRRAGAETPSFRRKFGLKRATLARLACLSERTIATWESGGEVGAAANRALLATNRLLTELAAVIKKRAIATWLDTPNPGFGKLKPIEVVERGQVDQIWRMIYLLGSGTGS